MDVKKSTQVLSFNDEQKKFLDAQGLAAYEEWKGLVEVCNIYIAAHQKAAEKLQTLINKNSELGELLRL